MMQQTYRKPIRSNGKYNQDFTSRDIYNSFKRDRKRSSPIKRDDYLLILKEFNDRIMKRIIFYNMEFVMPYKMGVLSVKKVKQKGITLDDKGNIKTRNLVIDFGKTNKLWESDPKAYKDRRKIYILNEHSDGYIYRFYWDKRRCNAKNQTQYIFKPIKKYKTYLRDAIMSDRKVDFYEIKAKKYYV